MPDAFYPKKIYLSPELLTESCTGDYVHFITIIRMGVVFFKNLNGSILRIAGY